MKLNQKKIEKAFAMLDSQLVIIVNAVKDDVNSEDYKLMAELGGSLERAKELFAYFEEIENHDS